MATDRDIAFPAGAVLALLTLLAGSLAAQQRPCDPPAPLAPSRDLYCIELVAAPGLDGAAGTVELGQVPGPFTVAVTAEGFPRHRLTLDAWGLPLYYEFPNTKAPRAIKPAIWSSGNNRQNEDGGGDDINNWIETQK